MREYHAKRQGKKEAQEEAKAHQKDAPRPKYRNRKTVVCGIEFDSKLEAKRYLQLRAMEEAGDIYGLQCQVKYAITIGGNLICHYVADFVYGVEEDGRKRIVVEDAKGKPTREYLIKKKLMLAVNGIAIVEFKAPQRGGRRERKPR